MTKLIEKVAELRKLEAKATPGPWDMNYNGSYEIFTAGHGPSESRDKTVMRWKDDGLPIRGKDSLLILIMRNAAPELLAALGKVHAKDSEILDLFVAFMERFKPDGHLNDIGPGTKITNAKAAACLRRYASMARLLEGKE